jgi:hypothetical protein
MTLETRLKDASEQLPVPHYDEPGAFDRFRRRRARKAAVTGAGAVLVAAAILVLPLAGVRIWPGAGGAVDPGVIALSPSSPGASGPPPARPFVSWSCHGRRSASGRIVPPAQWPTPDRLAAPGRWWCSAGGTWTVRNLGRSPA